MSPRQPDRRVPKKSHGLRSPGPAGRPPRDSAGTPSPSGAEGDATAPTPSAATPSSGTPQGAAFGAPTAKPGSRAANRAAKRAASGGVRPKTQVRGRRRSSARGSSTGLIVLGAIAVFVVAAVLVVANPFGSPAPSGSPAAAASATPIPSRGDGTCPTSQPASLKAGDVYEVTIETRLGNIVMKIDGALAPIATGNFVALVKCHFYDGIVFHRLMPGFVIQGGDPQGDGGGGPGYEIADDPVTTTYRRGTIAMARTPAPNSQGSQFFIVLADDADQSLSSAQYGYAILGEVMAGMDVVDEIAAMPNTGGQEGRALDPIAMESVTITSSPGASTAPTAAPASVAPASPAPTS